MSRQGRRNKTRWVKLWKRRGYVYRGGRLWRKHVWNMRVLDFVFSRDTYEPY